MRSSIIVKSCNSIFDGENVDINASAEVSSPSVTALTFTDDNSSDEVAEYFFELFHLFFTTMKHALYRKKKSKDNKAQLQNTNTNMTKN